MSIRRIWALVRIDLFAAPRRPLYLIFAALLLLMAWGLVAGNVRVGTGNSDAGSAQAWMNSEYNVLFTSSIVLGLFLPFFAAIAAGLPILNDADRKVDRLINATPLSRLEYAFARFLGAVVPLCGLLAFWCAAQFVFNNFWPVDNPDKVRGPISVINFVRPVLVLGVPQLFFVAGASALLGVLARQPILVFFLPVAIILGENFFLWSWSPTWLPASVNDLLGWLDPAGLRWLLETFVKADRGIEFYNTTAVDYSFAFSLSRVAFAALGLISIPLIALRMRHGGIGRRSRPATDSAPRRGDHSLASLAMTSRPIGTVDGALAMLRLETRQLVRSPGLWLFGPLILLQVIGTSFVALGAFDTPLLHTSGSLASRTFNTLTLLLVLLALFYTVESLIREERLGAAPMIRATGIRTGSLVAGKLLANSVVAAVMLACTFLACLLIIAIQAIFRDVAVPIEPGIFAIAWGFLLVPTMLVWTSFVAMVFGFTRNRYVTYGVGLGALILTGWCQTRGWLNWACNWHLWSAMRWSDLDRLEFQAMPLLWNRIFVLLLASLFIVLAVRLHPRRVRDVQQSIDRLRPWPLLRAALPVLPLALAAIVLGGFVYAQTRAGFQGAAAERLQKDYWRRNSATWERVPSAALDRIDARIELDPPQRHIEVEGTYVVRNPRAEPMQMIPVTPGLRWEDLTWTLDGAEIVATTKPRPTELPRLENRAGLFVFVPEQPLEKDQTIRIGFRFHATFPPGWTRNGGGASEFVLPSGVVLTSFSASFLPVVGYVEGVGVDEDNRRDAREERLDLWRDQVDPLFGSAWSTDARLEITGPADWTLNCVGIPGEPVLHDGRKTVEWVTDHPVRFLNIVGGPLESHAGESVTVFHDRRHPWNIKAMTATLDEARRWYSQWFHPYPWRDLKLTEFPGLASYAQGFPGDISFSEEIGFLTRPGATGDDGADAVFLVTAHESAHQWWGNILTPGKGPGGNILSEGMAHFSTILLFEQIKGTRAAAAFRRQIEQSYADGRVADAERPLNRCDGSRPGDGPVTYDRGGWVFWMMLRAMGREPALEGLRDFIDRFRDGPDFPLIEDLVATMREHAADKDAFDTFTQQWVFDTALPEFHLDRAELVQDGDGWRIDGTLVNLGSGRVEVAVAARLDEPEAGAPASADAAPDARATVAIGPGERVEFAIHAPFKPTRVVVDPDVELLQLRRKRAEKKL